MKKDTAHSGNFFFPYHMACGILVPQPGIEPISPALEAQSLKPLDQPYYLPQYSPGYHSSLNEYHGHFCAQSFPYVDQSAIFFCEHHWMCPVYGTSFLSGPPASMLLFVLGLCTNFPFCLEHAVLSLPVPSGCNSVAISSKVSSLVIQFREYILFLLLTTPHLLYMCREKYTLIS